MKRFGILIVGVMGELFGDKHVEGMWVRDYDPDWGDGAGRCLTTPHAHEAIAFGSISEAMTFYRMQPSVRPHLEDGTPNRPLTAFSITVQSLD